MTPSLFVDHFDRMSKGSDAVPRLRRFILDLAVRGKLVEQSGKDESASTLLNLIDGRLGVNSGAENSTVALPLENRPFTVPSKWFWAHLGRLCSKTGSGSTPRGGKSVYQPSGVPFLRSQNVHDDGLRLEDVAYITEETHQRMSGTALQADDLLLNITGGSIGRCCRVSPGLGKANVSQHVAIIRVAVPGIQPYMHLLIRSPYFQAFVYGEQTGAGRGGLPKNRMDLIPVALPPLAEQRRIVAKVDELMVLCDQLEASRAEREVRRNALVSAANHYVAMAADEVAFRRSADFFFHHLPSLTTREEHIEKLRKTLRALAVSGKLVLQDSNDLPARAQLESIQLLKTQLIAKGTSRKERPVAAPMNDDVPFSIPSTWAWVRIGTCSLSTDYGTSLKSDTAETGVPVLKMGDIRDGKVVLGGQKRVPPDIEDLPNLLLKQFDLLYNRTNSAELVGKTGIYRGEDDTYTFASYLIRIRFFNELTNSEFVNLAMNAPYFRATQIEPQLQQQCGQANVNGTKLREMLIPLPPISEQHRIVAKVNKLMMLCDRLEAHIVYGGEYSRRLLETILNSAVQGLTQKTLEALL